MNSKDRSLVLHLLEKEGVVLPYKLMKNIIIEELEKSLKSPILMSRFFSKISSSLEKYLKIDEIERFQNEIEKLKTHLKDYSITNEDIEIINFLVNESKLIELAKFLYFLQILGPLFYSYEILKETLDRELPKPIIVFIYINLYVSFYETILHLIDRTLYNIVNTKEEWKRQNKDFLEKIKRKEFNEHATAGEICKVLKNFKLKTENSIFGGKSETRIFRNKISHANIFYDSEEDKVVINTMKYDFKEFEKLFSRLFFFLVKWIEKWLNIDDFSKFLEKLKIEMKKNLNELSREFLKIGRSGYYSLVYHNYILKLESELSQKEK